MIISAIGINHKTAPIEVREKFYLTEIQQELLLSELKQQPNVCEAFVVSTCNRTEVYLHTIDAVKPSSLIKMIADIKALPYQKELNEYFYLLTDRQAVMHLLSVCCGLDSLVIGEKQIFGQLKEALELAKEKNFFLSAFNILANITVRTGKKARSETAIDTGGSSISWAAVTKAEQVLGELGQVRTLIIGAGKMSKLAVGQMLNKGFKELYLMNRTHENALALAEATGGVAVPFCDIKEVLSKVDFCICSSSAPHFILDHETVRKIMPLRQNRKLLFIDISMPRNIDPKIAQLENVKLYSIDDLDSVVEKNLNKRREAVMSVHKIIEAKTEEFFRKIARLKPQDELINQTL